MDSLRKSGSEQIKRILCHTGIRTAYKPMPRLGDTFGKLKDKQVDFEIKSIVYSKFVYSKFRVSLNAQSALLHIYW